MSVCVSDLNVATHLPPGAMETLFFFAFLFAIDSYPSRKVKKTYDRNNDNKIVKKRSTLFFFFKKKI